MNSTRVIERHWIVEQPEDGDGRQGVSEQHLHIRTANASDGDYLVIETDRWAVENVQQLVDHISMAVGKDAELNPTQETPAKNTGGGMTLEKSDEFVCDLLNCDASAEDKLTALAAWVENVNREHFSLSYWLPTRTPNFTPVTTEDEDFPF